MNVYVADPPSLSIDLCRMQAIGWDPPARDCWVGGGGSQLCSWYLDAGIYPSLLTISVGTVNHFSFIRHWEFLSIAWE
jgi:hypothetical protein